MRRNSIGAEQNRFLRARRRRALRLGIFVIAFAIVLGSLMARIDAGATVRTSRAGEILTSVGWGVLGLVTVIYSLLFLVVQSSNTTFTPRLNLFQDNPWIYRTYAFSLGLFAFCLSGFLQMGNAEVTVALPIFAFAAALVILVLAATVETKAFASLQMNYTLDTLQRNGRGVIEALYPAWPSTAQSHPPAPTGGRPVLWQRPQTTLQQLELRGLLAAAERSGSVTAFRVKVGETLWPGAIVAEISGNLDNDAVLTACVTGVNRTFNQDPLLAFRLLADIGLRAVSPAINDPATATQVLDAIVGLFLVLAPRDLAVGAINSPGGVTRVHVNLPAWPDFISEGLDELLIASRHSPMVLDRAATNLSYLARQVPPDRLSDVSSRLQQIGDYVRIGRPT